MGKFSTNSESILHDRVHLDLIRLFEHVVQVFDCTVLTGIRTIEQEKKYVASGLSKTMNSKHLPQKDGLSHAVDVAPYPQNWDVPAWEKDQILFAGFVLGVANEMGIAIRWGGDWNGNKDVLDNTFNDLDHFELITNTQ